MPEEKNKDGVAAIRATLNSQLLKLNEELLKPDCNNDFTLDRINEISKTLKKLPKEEKESKEAKKKTEKEKTGSFIDNAADDKRRD